MVLSPAPWGQNHTPSITVSPYETRAGTLITQVLGRHRMRWDVESCRQASRPPFPEGGCLPTAAPLLGIGPPHAARDIPRPPRSKRTQGRRVRPGACKGCLPFPLHVLPKPGLCCGQLGSALADPHRVSTVCMCLRSA